MIVNGAAVDGTALQRCDALTLEQKTDVLHSLVGGRRRAKRKTATGAKADMLAERPVQRALIRHFAALGCYAVHTPNGSQLAGDAKARAMQMAALKKDGVSPGFPDLTIIDQTMPRIGFVEVKREGRTDLDPDQVTWRDVLLGLGIPWALVNDPAGASGVLKLWGWR
ncbi:VRR-NUC domain-containing protein [Sphingomonas sp. CD22]|uniref:VRR-NUC domain-containing protein n=1 Tax=Sphingomonas sp. CD22 TaxID=3100214 RepID=UPI002AE01796|nr:VRR-NUC domain-containing protein [Sphingomonas sp. CD22]MEA1083241.1 VRR-NUC domain-containing protein [Sphingomonas sp. CD22]